MRLSNWHYTTLAWLLLLSTLGVVSLLFARAFKAGDCGTTWSVIELWRDYRALHPGGPLDGDYSRGMLTGQTLVLAGDRYVLVDFFDAGPACVPEWGTSIQSKNGVQIEIHRDRGRTVRRFDEYKYMRWGKAAYLVRKSELPDFIGTINWFGQDTGVGFMRDLDGFEVEVPQVPPEYKDFLRTTPITAEVVKVESTSRGDVMVLDKGNIDGLRLGMILHRAERSSKMIATVELTSVSDHESKARWYDLYYPEKVPAKVGWLWTTGAYTQPDRN